MKPVTWLCFWWWSWITRSLTLIALVWFEPWSKAAAAWNISIDSFLARQILTEAFHVATMLKFSTPQSPLSACWRPLAQTWLAVMTFSPCIWNWIWICTWSVASSKGFYILLMQHFELIVEKQATGNHLQPCCGCAGWTQSSLAMSSIWFVLLTELWVSPEAAVMHQHTCRHGY